MVKNKKFILSSKGENRNIRKNYWKKNIKILALEHTPSYINLKPYYCTFE